MQIIMTVHNSKKFWVEREQGGGSGDSKPWRTLYTVNPPLYSYSYISENARDIYMITRIWIKAVNAQLLQFVGYQFRIIKKKLFFGYQFVGYQFVDFGHQFVGYQFLGYQ